MTDEELGAWRAGLHAGERVIMDLGHYAMVGKLVYELNRLPDGERRWEVEWDFPDPENDAWEDHVSERWLQPEPVHEPKPARPPHPRRRGPRTAPAGRASA
ncbi:MAG TPA: hypothetical protein VOB72_22625 [Candidatus Dormibacteraeota bacterium]|nr:hypothetical protein [Candidatus Dormibacteraeota bacterium]